MNVEINFVETIKNVLQGPPEDWRLSQDFFHLFYENNLLQDQEGWNRSTVQRILNMLENHKSSPDKSLTELLLEKLINDAEATQVIKRLIELVKICDVHAYQQDNIKPVVAGTFVRQNIFYKKILNWKLEQRKESLFKDIIESQHLTSILKNVFLCLYEPQKYIFMVSPRHREIFINNVIDPNYSIQTFDDYNTACLETNEIILDYFRTLLASDSELLDRLNSAALNKHFLTRAISVAIYDKSIRPLWDNTESDGEYDGKNYWIYAPGAGARMWNEFSEQNLMGIGWDKLGDLRSYKTQKDIHKKIREIYNDKNPVFKAGICFAFTNEIKPGDIIFAKKGKKELIGYGIVESDYNYDSSRSEYSHIREVSWQMKGSWKLSEAQSDLSGYTLPIKTLSNITRFKSLVTDICELLGIQVITSYLPAKSDFEKAYRMVANLGQEISLDIVLDQIEENAKKKGYAMEENWREITENNIIENWQQE